MISDKERRAVAARMREIMRETPMPFKRCPNYGAMVVKADD